jgi:GTP cyclohydrolase II
MAEINEFIKKRPGLVWSTMQYDKLSEEVIVEAVLNYGDWRDVQEMIKILGIKKVALIFNEEAKQKRCNLRPEIVHYFNLYFKRYA